jgi:hypothetical protein
MPQPTEQNLYSPGQPIEQRGGHLGIAEHAGPFAEGETTPAGSSRAPAKRLRSQWTISNRGAAGPQATLRRRVCTFGISLRLAR